MHFEIRDVQLKDQAEIYRVETEAFGQEDEAKLVDLLHQHESGVISLVAESAREIIGHILLSEMSSSEGTSLKIYGLAPMAVLPEYQHKGIGTKLIDIAIKRAIKLGVDAIFVLGHPSYYPKFGFKSTQDLNIKCEYDVPPEVFMVFDITGKLEELNGQVVLYAKEFNETF